MLWRILLLFISLASCAFATTPVLNFSDITSGPKTGIGDGLGSGVIVTIWGNNLGSSQGTSKVYCNGAEAAYVYYWKNADGTIPSGPSDLYTHNKMQEIAFSVSSSAIDGSGTIYVTVGGANSNTLPFTVRAGGIKHVKTTGSDSTGTGTWSNPWATIGMDANSDGNWDNLTAGDTVYLHNGLLFSDTFNDGSRNAGIRFAGRNGTESNPLAVAVYPGGTVIARGTYFGILNHGTEYCTVSKIKVEAGYQSPSLRAATDGSTTANSGGISSIKYGRFIGNTITDREGTVGDTGCADGGQGAIYGGANNGLDTVSGAKFYGNTIFEWGCATTHKYEHTTYITNRSGQTSGAGSNFNVAAWEWGWNVLKDNHARGGITAYDENNQDSDPCGDVTGTLKIHDNVVINQLDVGISVGTDSGSGATLNCWSMPIEVYNNLLINAGSGADQMDGQTNNTAISFTGRGLSSAVKVYNNTIYGTKNTSATGTKGVFYLPDSGHWSGTVEWVNNIVYTVDSIPFSIIGEGSEESLTRSSNNIWYSSGLQSPPSFDTLPITIDPLLIEYSPSGDSPAIDAGADLSLTFATDLFGNSRSFFDIGAIEAISSQSITAPIPFRIPGGMPYGIVQ